MKYYNFNQNKDNWWKKHTNNDDTTEEGRTVEDVSTRTHPQCKWTTESNKVHAADYRLARRMIPTLWRKIIYNKLSSRWWPECLMQEAARRIENMPDSRLGGAGRQMRKMMAGRRTQHKVHEATRCTTKTTTATTARAKTWWHFRTHCDESWVAPMLTSLLMSAPASNSIWTMASSPRTQAYMRGVMPCRRRKLGVIRVEISCLIFFNYIIITEILEFPPLAPVMRKFISCLLFALQTPPPPSLSHLISEPLWISSPHSASNRDKRRVLAPL